MTSNANAKQSTDGSYYIAKLHPYQKPPASADVIAWGGGNLLTEFFDANKIRDEAKAIRTWAETRADNIRTTHVEFSTQISEIAARLDAFERRVEAFQAFMDKYLGTVLDQQLRATKARIQAKIDSLPDSDDPNSPAIYEPSGELHSLTALQDDEEPNDFPYESEGGTLRPPEELGYSPTPKERSPVAVSLGSDDDDETMTLGGNPPSGRVGY